MDEDTSERLALSVLCDELPALRAQCAGAGSEEKRRLLAEIEAAARARRPILGLLNAFVGAGAERGLGGGLPGAGPGRADEETFGCPDGACNRVAGGVPAGPPPRCQVTGLAMRRR